MEKAVNLKDKLALIKDFWSPGVVAAINDYHVKLVRIKGEFTWHSHADTDELFLVLKGQMKILLRDGAVELKQGELYVVSKGVEHKPVAEDECEMLLLEPEGTINTGDSPGELTVEKITWL